MVSLDMIVHPDSLQTKPNSREVRVTSKVAEETKMNRKRIYFVNQLRNYRDAFRRSHYFVTDILVRIFGTMYIYPSNFCRWIGMVECCHGQITTECHNEDSLVDGLNLVVE